MLYVRLFVALIDVVSTPVKMTVSTIARHDPEFRDYVIRLAQVRCMLCQCRCE